jgi:hypothetical protein
VGPACRKIGSVLSSVPMNARSWLRLRLGPRIMASERIMRTNHSANATVWSAGLSAWPPRGAATSRSKAASARGRSSVLRPGIMAAMGSASGSKKGAMVARAAMPSTASATALDDTLALRRLLLGGRQQVGKEALHLALGVRHEDVLAGGEVPIERGAPETGLVGDVSGARLGHAPRRDDTPGRVEDPLDRARVPRFAHGAGRYNTAPTDDSWPACTS